uniref:MATH domain-containing protein n=1 Tax=Panagrellus redivivus TaxID=6233 RepID=A0A7E4VP51_PANRE
MPISLDQLDCIRDKSDQNSIKLINFTYWHRRWAQSEFHTQLIITAITEKIESVYQIRLKPALFIILKNKTWIGGEVVQHTIPKNPKNPLQYRVIDLTDVSSPFNTHYQIKIYTLAKVTSVFDLKLQVFLLPGTDTKFYGEPAKDGWQSVASHAMIKSGDIIKDGAFVIKCEVVFKISTDFKEIRKKYVTNEKLDAKVNANWKQKIAKLERSSVKN